jgi:hypothetical protein
MVQADRLVGGLDGVVGVEDTALPKKGTAWVGVAPQLRLRWARTPTAGP